MPVKGENGYVGSYQGKEIWEKTLKEFMALPSVKQNDSDIMYLITEDYRVICGGYVCGTINKAKTRFDNHARVAWRVAYAHILQALEEERKAKAKVKAQMKAAVVTERPTVENLSKPVVVTLNSMTHEAENKLAEIQHETQEKVEEVLGDAHDAVNSVETIAEKALETLVEEGEAKLTALAEQKPVVRKRSTTTKAKPRVKPVE